MRIDGLISRMLMAVMFWGLTMGLAQAQFAGGDGSPGSPFQIANQAQFMNIVGSPSAAYELIDDISLTQFTNVAVFTGQLDGQGHTIDFDITESGEEFYGLFRELGAGGVIRDLRLAGQISLADALFSGALAADMSGGLIEQVHSQVTLTVAGTRHDGTIGSGTGGLVARKTGGTIRQSSNTGLVRGYLAVGGLASRNWGGLIEQSFNSGTVWATGFNGAGGIVENNRASIVEVYSTGRVTGSNGGSLVEAGCTNCGGLVGVMTQGSVLRSYSTGFVNSTSSNSGAIIGQLAGTFTVAGLFFDAQTSGQAQGAGGTGGGALAGTGRTTAEMKDPATFTAAGWDFVDVWQVATTEDPEAISYPYFQVLTYDPFDQVVAESPAPGIVGPARRVLIEGPSTVTAGESQNIRLVARDVRDQPVALFTGTRSVVFTGAAPGPDGSLPTVRSALEQEVPFGGEVALTFTEGVAEPSALSNGIMTLFLAGSTTISATVDAGALTTEPGDSLLVDVQPAALDRFELSLTGPQVNAEPFVGTNEVAAFDRFSNLIVGFDASVNPVTLSSQVGAQISGLGTGGGATLNRSSDFVNGIASLEGQLVYTGAVSNSPILASSSDGRLGISTPVEILPGAPANMAAVAGDGQAAVVGQAVVIAPQVQITDVSGNPVAGVAVLFQAQGDGSVTGASTTTDSQGLAQVGGWVLGTVAGNQLLQATAGSLSATFTATGTAGAPDQMLVEAGDGQSGQVTTSLPVAPAVIVRDQFGNPVPDVSVTFAVTSGGGSLAGDTAVTGSDGIAAAGVWTLGETAGEQTVQATIAGLDPVVLTATATASAPVEMVIERGDNQAVRPTRPVRVAPAVLVRDTHGNPVPDVLVVFSVIEGGGSVSEEFVTTDSQGVAEVAEWVLGSEPGVNRLRAASPGLDAVIFLATGLPNPVFSDRFETPE